MALADRDWRLIREEAWEGPTNMALDEVAAATAAASGPRTVRVYRWDPSTLSLGYNQDPATVDWDYCQREGISVTRRPTGGGGIYHDTYGDISYTIVAPADELPGDLLESYELLCQPILDAFERMGIDAGFATESQPEIHQPACYLRKLHPAHDVVVDGRKISGNAQYRRKDAIIQHGSLTFRRRTDRHLSTFADHDVSPGAFDERVTSISEEAPLTRGRAVEILAESLQAWTDATVGSWHPDELSVARERARRKFASDAWTRERTDPLASEPIA